MDLRVGPTKICTVKNWCLQTCRTKLVNHSPQSETKALGSDGGNRWHARVFVLTLWTYETTFEPVLFENGEPVAFSPSKPCCEKPFPVGSPLKIFTVPSWTFSTPPPCPHQRLSPQRDRKPHNEDSTLHTARYKQKIQIKHKQLRTNKKASKKTNEQSSNQATKQPSNQATKQSRKHNTQTKQNSTQPTNANETNKP